jgi:hypothetical protein
VTVALRMLPTGDEALRHEQMQVVLGPRHRHIEQTAFFLDFGRRPATRFTRNTAWRRSVIAPDGRCAIAPVLATQAAADESKRRADWIAVLENADAFAAEFKS